MNKNSNINVVNFQSWLVVKQLNLINDIKYNASWSPMVKIKGSDFEANSLTSTLKTND